MLTCIEAVVNTRPLTKVDPQDLTSLPLRPVDFLQGNLKFSLPESSNSDERADPSYGEATITNMEQAKEALKFAEDAANSFWIKWHREYLTELRNTHKSSTKQTRHSSRSEPEIGEIVLILPDEPVPRSNWPLGRIVEVVRSSDGLVRSAKVITSSGKTSHRPIAKLVPLEIRSSLTGENMTRTTATKSETEQIPQRASLPRKAKENARYYESTQDCDSPNSSRTANIHSLTRCLLYPLLLLQFAVPSHAQPISCENGIVKITPAMSEYTLCFNQVCRPQTQNSSTLFTLPPSVHNPNVNVAIHSDNDTTSFSYTENCKRFA
ncbi:hypothetical protein V3C99_011922 [Haemonchus contortus]